MESEVIEPKEGEIMSLLTIDHIRIKFGGLLAVDDFSLQIKDHQLVGLIGPNGAGKTTVFNLLTGVYTPSQGTITLKGRSLVGKRPDQIVMAGLGRTFQNIRLFKKMSVLGNIKAALVHVQRYSMVDAIFRTPAFIQQEHAIHTEAIRLLALFHLEGQANQPASSLSYGNQRKLEIARALALRPLVLLLDEPAAGMNPQEKEELMATIQRIKDEFQVSVLLIEHDMKLVMGICEEITVLDHGRVIARGTPSEVRTNPAVIKAYLGG